MKRTLNLILKTTFRISPSLVINWFFYSLSLVTFNLVWVLLPEKISGAIMFGGRNQMIFAGLTGVFASVSLFLSTYLKNNSWMKMNRVRYEILLKLLHSSLRIPYQKSLDSDYLAKIEKTRSATINPAVGIGVTLSSFYEMPGTLFSAVALFGILSRISFMLGIVVLLSVAISFRLNLILNQKDEQDWDLASDPRRKFERTYDILMEEVYAKDIRMFSCAGLLDCYGKKFSSILSTIHFSALKEKLRYQILQILNHCLLNFVIYIWIALYVLQGKVHIGSFLTYSLGVIHLSLSLQAVFAQSSTIAREERKFREYWVIQDEADSSEFFDEKMPLKENVDEYTIEFDGVSFTYPDASEPAINDVSFTIMPKSQTAIVGLNGAGKTTIIKLLCRLYSPTKGKIFLNGVDIEQIPKGLYYDLLSVVFQDGSIFPYSIKENVVMSKTYLNQDYLRAIELSGLKKVIDQLPNKDETYLTNIIDQQGVELSGGEFQKLLLARAIYNGGKIFLLDEPAGALDPIAEEQIYNDYSRITKKSTSIIISHQLSFIVSCDYIVVLQNGKILEQGTHSDLTKNKGIYYEMYMEQKRQYEE